MRWQMIMSDFAPAISNGFTAAYSQHVGPLIITKCFAHLMRVSDFVFPHSFDMQ
jgi:hypothetical protein